MSEIKGYLQTGVHNSYGVVGTIFIDSIDNLGKMQEIVGMDINALAEGSVAFDKLQNVAVYDGSHWVLDDGTELPNWVKNWVIPMQTVNTSLFEYYVQPQTFTPAKGDGDFYEAYLTCLTSPRWSEIWSGGDNVQVMFDGETYECPMDAYDVDYRCSVEGKFTVVFPNGYWDDDKIQVVTPDGNQHTLAIVISEEDDPNATLNDVENPLPNTITVVFNGKEYTVARSEEGEYGAPWSKDLGGYDWSVYPFAVYNGTDSSGIVTENEAECTVGAYVLEEESSGETIVFLDNYQIPGADMEEDNNGYSYEFGNDVSMLPAPEIVVTYNGVTSKLTRRGSGDIYEYGAEFDSQAISYDFSTYPYYIDYSGGIYVVFSTNEDASMTIKAKNLVGTEIYNGDVQGDSSTGKATLSGVVLEEGAMYRAQGAAGTNTMIAYGATVKIGNDIMLNAGVLFTTTNGETTVLLQPGLNAHIELTKFVQG